MEIPTAEEFINQGLHDSGFEFTKAERKIIAQKLKSFTKLHVEAALNAASEIKTKGQYSGLFFDRDTDDKDSILNSYPLSNIK